jgi:hypothetical protein
MCVLHPTATAQEAVCVGEWLRQQTCPDFLNLLASGLHINPTEESNFPVVYQ